MLKWTASAQRLGPNQPSTSASADVAKRLFTPTRTLRFNTRRGRDQRRATIANSINNSQHQTTNINDNSHNFWYKMKTDNDKENIPVTSTPMIEKATLSPRIRMRNSPLILTPFVDILNINMTPETSPLTMTNNNMSNNISRRRPIAETLRRRHSTVVSGGFTHSTISGATLPSYDEEDYSPNAVKVLPTGQQIALRGLLTTMPEIQPIILDEDLIRKNNDRFQKNFAFTEFQSEEIANTTSTMNSAKMGDKTLDHLIDAILDSARKDEKKKKPRKSFNLRRRTLLRQQTGSTAELLSPSYTAGYDPASDLSLPMEAVSMATPIRGIPTISDTVLCGMSTPAPHPAKTKSRTSLSLAKNDSFTLATPVSSISKRRRALDHGMDLNEETTSHRGEEDSLVAAKKFKADKRKYFEVGLALPSIYV